MGRCRCCGHGLMRRAWIGGYYQYCEMCRMGDCPSCKVPTPEERAPSSLPGRRPGRCKECGAVYEKEEER